jgi:hypothetical protein
MLTKPPPDPDANVQECFHFKRVMYDEPLPDSVGTERIPSSTVDSVFPGHQSPDSAMGHPLQPTYPITTRGACHEYPFNNAVPDNLSNMTDISVFSQYSMFGNPDFILFDDNQHVDYELIEGPHGGYTYEDGSNNRLTSSLGQPLCFHCQVLGLL